MNKTWLFLFKKVFFLFALIEAIYICSNKNSACSISTPPFLVKLVSFKPNRSFLSRRSPFFHQALSSASYFNRTILLNTSSSSLLQRKVFSIKLFFFNQTIFQLLPVEGLLLLIHVVLVGLSFTSKFVYSTILIKFFLLITFFLNEFHSPSFKRLSKLLTPLSFSNQVRLLLIN